MKPRLIRAYTVKTLVQALKYKREKREKNGDFDGDGRRRGVIALPLSLVGRLPPLREDWSLPKVR